MKIRIDALDTLFSKAVRLRAGGKCEFCGQAKNLQCSHFHGRRKLSTRFDFDNASGLCMGCHSFLGDHPNIHTDFFEGRLGSQRFEELNIRAQMIIKRTPQIVEELMQSLKEKIKRMEEQ